MEGSNFTAIPLTRTPLHSQLDQRTQLLPNIAHTTLGSIQTELAACDKMTTIVRVLRLQGICITLQLLLLLVLLPYSHASPCPTTIEEMVVANTSDAGKLAEALMCDGPGTFGVTWHGNVMLSRTLSVSNGSTLNVVGYSESTDDTDTSAAVISDGTVLLFEIALGSTASLTGLTLSGGNGALRVSEKSFVELIDCNFTDNNRTSPYEGGELNCVYMYAITHSRPLAVQNTVFLGKGEYGTTGSTSFDQNKALFAIQLHPYKIRKIIRITSPRYPKIT